MNLYLVRHAQSHANLNPYTLRETPNPRITLTDLGNEQAIETGIFLSKIFKDENKKTLKIFVSPYTRTRETYENIANQLSNEKITFDKAEDISIVERQFGLVDDCEHYVHEHTKEWGHYQLYKKFDCDFFARPPLGESPFDLTTRIESFIHNRLLSNNQHKNVIIVSHGAAIRSFLTVLNKWEYENYFIEKNPPNSSVRFLNVKSVDDVIDNGYLFKPSSDTN